MKRSRKRVCSEAWQDKAMERALTHLNKRADGSCARYAILQDVASEAMRWCVIRRQKLADAASQFFPSIATRLGISSKWLEVENITLIAMAL